jgi:hypothetical protein
MGVRSAARMSRAPQTLRGVGEPSFRSRAMIVMRCCSIPRAWSPMNGLALAPVRLS